MNIYESVCKVIEEVGAIGKEKKNQQQGFMYRGVDDVMNALQPLFAKHKIFIVPEILEQSREERTGKSGGNLIYSICKVAYTFYAEDGSNVKAVVIGEGMDSGDKATNKAMSIAFKYACFQVFCIATEEMQDPDGEKHELQPKEPSEEPPQKPPEPWKMTKEQANKIQTTAQNKGVSLLEFGKKVTKKEGSQHWNGTDYTKVLAELMKLEDKK